MYTHNSKQINVTNILNEEVTTMLYLNILKYTISFDIVDIKLLVSGFLTRQICYVL